MINDVFFSGEKVPQGFIINDFLFSSSTNGRFKYIKVNYSLKLMGHNY